MRSARRRTRSTAVTSDQRSHVARSCRRATRSCRAAVASASANEPAVLKTLETFPYRAGRGNGPRERGKLGDGTVAVQHEHGSSAPNVLEVTGQVVLQLGNSGLFHIAMLAMS